MRRIRRGTKFIVAVLALLAAVAALRLGLFDLRLYRANLKELKTDLTSWSVGGKDERALIIAPHCDDETLGCGGVIGKLVKEGAQVRVVLVTNGDGYHEIVRRIRLAGPKGYVRFGLQRQKETLAALRTLGLPDSCVTFLGYPDRGVAGMWLTYRTPDNLFRSRYTRRSHSPYPNSFRPNAPYCGEALLADLKAIIKSYRPTTIYYPHPSDQHSDHWAVYCFVTEALYEMGLRDKVRTSLYIVHRGDWPTPKGLHPTLPLRPPAFLSGIGMRWFESGLSEAEIAQKLKAISMYRTQMPFLGEFLRSFSRTNELFGEYESATIPRFDASENESEVRACEQAPPSVVDPVGDSLRVDVGRAGDIRFLRCYYDETDFHARIELAHPHSRRMSYGVQLYCLPNGSARRMIATYSSGGKVRGASQAQRSGNTVDFTIPLSHLGDWTAILACADSSMDSRKVDRTAWRLLLRESDSATSRPSHPAAARLPARRTQASPARKSS